MLVAAAVCPHPPLLVPQVAGAAAPELDSLRDACRQALDALADARPDLLVVVGGGTETRGYPQGTTGTLRRFGVAVDVTLAGWTPGPPDPAGGLPLSLTIGAWLLGEQGSPAPCPVEGLEVPSDADPAACAALGAAVAARADRVALLVMADGSARRSPQAPGYSDPRAVPADDALVRALAAADTAALAALDPTLARDLLVHGRAAVRVLAGAAGGTSWRGEVLTAQDPYGVLYVVATWTGR